MRAVPAVGPTTSTPAVTAKRKRPILLSPGLSPLKIRSELADSTVLKPKESPASPCEGSGYFSDEDSQDSSIPNTEPGSASGSGSSSSVPATATTRRPPAKRRRRQGDVSVFSRLYWFCVHGVGKLCIFSSPRLFFYCCL